MPSREIIVSVSLGGRTERVGRLFCHLNKGRESADFEYDKAWLSSPAKFPLEPALRLTQGPFQTQKNQIIFGSIGDSAPERWGRTLMKRAETLRAKERGETERTLTEADFLLGVNDRARLGALRFSEPAREDIYLAADEADPIPPLTDLPKLLSASEHFLQDDENKTAADLRLLIAPGSSLGGARAKASVMDSGELYLAKFPQKNDEHNIILWEIVTLDLAEKAGLAVSHWRRENITDKPVLLLRRFDRAGAIRIPFLSAMSMLGASDGETDHCYLELADALDQRGAAPKQDKQQLWRRIVFTVLISNTDDHLRNHGFLYDADGRGWRLSPAYDMNPTPASMKQRFLSTAIDFNDNRASLDLALDTAGYFDLTQTAAKNIVREVYAAAQQWRETAARYGLKKSEIDYMSSAFEHEGGRKAAAM